MINGLIAQFGAEETGAGFGALGIDAKAFLIQLATFVLVFLVLRKFVFGRMVKLLEDRRETIEQGIRLTTEMVSEKDKLREQTIEIRRKARHEADGIIASGHERAGAIITEAETAAQRKIDAMIADAQKKIEEETERARRALEKEMVELVIQATEIVAREKITPQKDSNLIARALRGLS